MSSLPHEGRIVPYLVVDGAEEAIRFYVEAFGAEEVGRLEMPDGRIGHAELVIAGNPIYLADRPDGMDVGHGAISLTRYVEDVDADFERAVAAGAKPSRPPKDEYYGDRMAEVVDPFGHRWSLQQRLEDLSFEEMNEMMRSAGG